MEDGGWKGLQTDGGMEYA